MPPASVARITGVSLRKVQYEISAGRLRSVLWGGRRLVPVAALAEALGLPESELHPPKANDVTSPAIPSKDLENVPHKKVRAASSQKRPAVVIVRNSKHG